MAAEGGGLGAWHCPLAPAGPLQMGTPGWPRSRWSLGEASIRRGQSFPSHQSPSAAPRWLWGHRTVSSLLQGRRKWDREVVGTDVTEVLTLQVMETTDALEQVEHREDGAALIHPIPIRAPSMEPCVPAWLSSWGFGLHFIPSEHQNGIRKQWSCGWRFPFCGFLSFSSSAKIGYPDITS